MAKPVPDYETVEYWKEKYLAVRREQGEDEGLREALEHIRAICLGAHPSEEVRPDIIDLVTAALAAQDQK